ncbi:MAG: hypothetical protein KJ886_02590 [Candidatus Thermoplasmatota archaeon]|nr:hypothetical protein [Candidatus Thermoplasmatota archaeon]MBU4256231.1 hypothetical protein [Candidatus Thermoplasmatota archaeon]MCG2826953.1 hypothetical protein [Thermoplasmatales archaeon]
MKQNKKKKPLYINKRITKRINRRKTETIKERAIYVYLPSHNMVKDWKGRADNGGLSISKFVIEHVENSLRQEENHTYVPRSKLLEKVKGIEEENKKLMDENRMLKTLVEKFDNELKRYRAAPFLDEKFEGFRRYEKMLVELLREKKFVRSNDVLRLLNIDPSDAEITKALWRQLENLETYGLVESELNGWRWKK